MSKMKIVIASSGASGVNLGLKTLKLLPNEIDKHFIMTKNSEIVLDKEMKLLPTLMKSEIHTLIKDETIYGGMLPKIDACLESIDGGVAKAHIIDGRVEHSLLLELFTSEGIGTVIKK